MIIQRNPDARAAVLRHVREQLKSDRTGIHLSDLIYCAGKAHYRKIGKAPEMTDDQAVTFWVGHMAQYFILPVRQDDSATITVDGVTMTPDAMNQYFGGVHMPLVEIKSSRASSAKFSPEHYPHYITQMLGYCKGTGKLECELLVLFLRGDYKEVMSCLDVWKCTFTQDEVDKNWAEMLRRKAILEESLRTGEFPKEITMAFEKEHKYCECSAFCPSFNHGGLYDPTK